MNETKDYTSDAFYSEKYDERDWRDQRMKDARYLISQVRQLNPFWEKCKVLDAGCGSGDLGVELIRQFQVDCYGMELNDVAIKHANKRGVNAKKVDLDGRWLYDDGFFDVVTGTEIIEHVINPDHFILEAKRVLKPNGLLILTTPNISAWFNRIIFLFGYQPFFTEVSTVDKTIGLQFTRKLTPNRKPMGHIRCFTLKALKEILEMHGFEIVLVKGNEVYYLPKYMNIFDKYIFRFFPGFSSDVTVVGRKIE